ncbi:hypothetical protein T484DRAFT_1801754 [Baffinella frigidus]|nr:hypothetical protein T484DRAFT_1801754 [Cryptophyta sp. CCMP2293]
MDTSSKVVAACVVAFGALLVSEIQARLNPLSGSGRRGAIRAGGAGHEPPPPFAADIPEGKNLTVGVGTFGGGGSAPLRAKDSAAKMIEKTYEIEATHLEFLLAMVQKYKIPDADKAARISIPDTDKAARISVQFAISDGDAKFAISDGDAKAIFETKRCNTCGGKKKKQPVTLKLYPTQAKFISAQVEKFKAPPTLT